MGIRLKGFYRGTYEIGDGSALTEIVLPAVDPKELKDSAYVLVRVVYGEDTPNGFIAVGGQSFPLSNVVAVIPKAQESAKEEVREEKTSICQKCGGINSKPYFPCPISMCVCGEPKESAPKEGKLCDPLLKAYFDSRRKKESPKVDWEGLKFVETSDSIYLQKIMGAKFNQLVEIVKKMSEGK